MYKDLLLKEGVKENNIIEIALDRKEYIKYRNPNLLYEYIMSKINHNEQFYVFIDEIQMSYKIKNQDVNEKYIPEEDKELLYTTFYDILNDLMSFENIDVYVTGSNSKMLSKDIVTNFRDRGSEITVFPLSFTEYCSVSDMEKMDALEEYMMYGGMPLSVIEKDELEKKKYLLSLHNNVFVKDITERYNLKDDVLLSSLIDILYSSVGSLTNTHKLSNTAESVMKIKSSDNTIKKYLDYGIFICIKDLDYEVIKKSLCAMLNNMFGQILIGIGQNNEIVGIASSKEQLLEDINIIFNEPDSSFKNILKDIEILELSHECYVAVISVVNVFEKIYGLEDSTYFYNFKNKNIYKPSIAEVEKYIKNKIYKRLEYIQNKNVTYQKNIIENLEMISKPFYQMSLHNKLLNKGVLFLQAVEKIFIVNDFYNVNINFPPGNGNVNGKYYFSMDADIRIDDAILRYSCPVSENIEGLEIKNNIYEPGEYIVMKKTGASFYINSNEEWYYCSKDSSDIIINSSSINTKVLLAWLKSSFYIFYCFFDEKVENITDVNTIPRLFLPDFNKLTNKQNSELEKIVIEILSLEQQYLCNELDLSSKITNKKINNKEYESKYYSLIREHNKKVSDLTREIDSLFMEILDITNDERKYVSHCIKQKGLYDLY